MASKTIVKLKIISISWLEIQWQLTSSKTQDNLNKADCTLKCVTDVIFKKVV